MRILTINKNDAGQRLDKFLSKSLPSLPHSLMYKAIRTKKIKVNRKRAGQGQCLCEGDAVQLFLPEEFFTPAAKENAFRRLDASPDIVYEDDDIILIDKKPGVSVHPDREGECGTLIDIVKAYLYRKGEYDPDSEQSFAPALCNRIDRNTGGIVIAAKNAAALRRINELIRDRKITKKYYCAVHGIMEKKSGRLKNWLLKDSETNTVTVYDKKPSSPDARSAESGYTVISEKDGLSLLEVELFTGRTHQIRAQFAHAGHPLVGDGKYGINRRDAERGYKFQALYSYYVKIDGKEYTVGREKIGFIGDLFG